MTSYVERTVTSGVLGAAAAGVAAAVAGRRQTGSYAAPLNATSHIVWGNDAARRSGVSAKHTGVGVLLHLGASLFWSAIYHALPGPSAVRAPAVAGLAYVVDYHVVPQRLTPGFEMRISTGALAAVYAALALGFLCSARATGDTDALGENRKLRAG